MLVYYIKIGLKLFSEGADEIIFVLKRGSGKDGFGAGANFL